MIKHLERNADLITKEPAVKINLAKVSSGHSASIFGLWSGENSKKSEERTHRVRKLTQNDINLLRRKSMRGPSELGIFDYLSSIDIKLKLEQSIAF